MRSPDEVTALWPHPRRAELSEISPGRAVRTDCELDFYGLEVLFFDVLVDRASALPLLPCLVGRALGVT